MVLWSQCGIWFNQNSLINPMEEFGLIRDQIKCTPTVQFLFLKRSKEIMKPKSQMTPSVHSSQDFLDQSPVLRQHLPSTETETLSTLPFFPITVRSHCFLLKSLWEITVQPPVKESWLSWHSDGVVWISSSERDLWSQASWSWRGSLLFFFPE